MFKLNEDFLFKLKFSILWIRYLLEELLEFSILDSYYTFYNSFRFTQFIGYTNAQAMNERVSLQFYYNYEYVLY